MEDLTELSKSRWFTVQDGTVVVALLSASRPDQLEILPGSIVDSKYQIISLLGRGGMGAVFKAHHLGLDKDVALKTFSTSQLTEEARLRFQREAQAIGKLLHRNIIQVFDYGLSQGDVPYYTMEFLLGETLADRISKSGGLRPADALKLFLQVSEGLAVAHSKGIIHRDLKPANLFIERVPSPKGPLDSIKIVDFGIAALTDQSADGQKLTTSGAVFGSPLYMSPEQSLGDVVSVASDVYSFGCALFEALTGKPPFKGANALATLMLHQKKKPPTLQEAAGGREFHPALEKAIAAMLAKSPEARPADMEQVNSILARIKPDQTFKLKRIQRNESRYGADPNNGEALQWADTDQTHAGKRGAWLPVGAALAALVLLAGAGLIALNFHSLSHAPGIISGASGPSSASPSSAGQFLSDKASAGIDHTDNGSSSTPDKSTLPFAAGVEKPQPASYPAAAKGVKPRREIVEVRGRKILLFTFREGLKLGEFLRQGEPHSIMSAVGQVSWPVGTTDMGFIPSLEFLQEPGNFAVFEKDDLYGVSLVHGEVEIKDNNLLKHLAHLSGLHFLDLEQSNADDECLPSLLQMKGLRSAKLINTGISGTCLAKLPALRDFSIVTFTNCPDVSGLLKGLKGSRSLLQLYIDGEMLTSADVNLIGSLTNLQVLQANDSHLNPDDLTLLTGLKSLHKLHVVDCSISAKQIQALHTMVKNGLRDLVSSSIGLSAKDQRMIKQLLPNARLENRDAARLEDATPTEWQKFPGSFDPEIK